jgi:hypothetical protein
MADYSLPPFVFNFLCVATSPNNLNHLLRCNARNSSSIKSQDEDDNNPGRRPSSYGRQWLSALLFPLLLQPPPPFAINLPFLPPRLPSPFSVCSHWWLALCPPPDFCPHYLLAAPTLAVSWPPPQQQQQAFPLCSVLAGCSAVQSAAAVLRW